MSENNGTSLYIDEQGTKEGSSNVNIDNESGASAEVHSTGALSMPVGGPYGSGDAYVELFNGRLTRNGTLPQLNVPYRIKDTLYNNTEIVFSIESGTTLLFAPNTQLDLGWAGNAVSFQADGIELLGANGSAGDWQGVRWSNFVNTDSYIRNSTISHADEAGLRIGDNRGADFTGNTINQTTGYCIDKQTADMTDYAATNTLDCTVGDIKP